MTKKFYFPALAASFVAMVLLLLVTISTPLAADGFSPFDVVRSNDLNGVKDTTPDANPDRLVGGIRFGTWGYCTARNGTNSWSCYKQSHGYSVSLQVDGDENRQNAAALDITIKSSWTRGLAIHVVAFAFSVLGLALAAVPKQMFRLAAAGTLALTALLDLIAFACDIVLFVYAQRKLKDVAPSADTMPGPMFYMALIALPILVAASLLCFFNWRSEKLDNVAYTGYNYGADKGASANDSSIPLEPTSEARVMQAYESSKA